jgi:VWFA-related protein
MKTITIAAATAALVFTASFAQQINERIEVNLVNVDVTVTSKGGAPVRDLTRSDFDIFEDGKRQTITNFYASDETHPAVSAVRVTAAVPAASTPAVEPDERFRRKVLVLVDNHHTTRRGRDRALAQLDIMVNDTFHGDYDWSIGVIGRGVTLVLPLSSDKAAIHEALGIVRRLGTRAEGAATIAGAIDRGGVSTSKNVDLPSWSVFDADFASRVQQAADSDDTERALASKFTVPAIIDAARGFATTPGRKIVLLLTGDLGLNDTERVSFGGPGGGMTVRGVSGMRVNEEQATQRTLESVRRSIVQEANSADVSFFLWNVEGLDGADLTQAHSANLATLTNNSSEFWIANETGGRLVAGNDPARSLQEFDTTSSSFYSLGYTPSHPDDGKYHAISVRLKRPGKYALSYRSGYSSSSSAVQLARAMTSPTAAAMQSNVLGVTLGLGAPTPDGSNVSVPIEVKVPFRSVQFLPGKEGVVADLVVYVSVFNDIGQAGSERRDGLPERHQASERGAPPRRRGRPRQRHRHHRYGHQRREVLRTNRMKAIICTALVLAATAVSAQITESIDVRIATSMSPSPRRAHRCAGLRATTLRFSKTDVRRRSRISTASRSPYLRSSGHFRP